MLIKTKQVNIVCLLWMVLLQASCSVRDKATMLPVVPERKLVWSDEFNYTGLPDSSKWGYEVGFVRNGEPQYYTNKRLENCRVENGSLIIEARKESFQNAAYTSASINTLGKQTWQYGRVEVRAKLPAGKGTWPAIWMLGENRAQYGWPICGEIDIMEFLGKDPTTVYGTMHYPDTTATKHGSMGGKIVVNNVADGFHLFAMEWDAQKITCYYDAQPYFVFDIKNSQHTSYNPFQKKFYLLLNMALGKQGSWPGPTDDSILPVRYEVDYVRIYQ